MRKHQYALKNELVMAFLFFMVTSIWAQQDPAVWFVKAGAMGDGTSIQNPIGSTKAVEDVSLPTDLIVILSGEDPLDGGFALKSGQVLIGLPHSDQKPVITNTNPERNGGSGLILAGDNRIWNIRIENTFASGIVGSNVSGNRIEEVEILGPNQSGTTTDLSHPLFGKFPHGGIIFLNNGDDLFAENYIADVDIVDARAIGLASFAKGGAQSRLFVYGSRVEGGNRLNRTDMGILAMADGPSSQTILEVDKSVVQGRTSMAARNIVVFASRDAKASAVIEMCTLGPVGQDGVLAVASQIPAEVSLDIRGINY